MTEPAPVPHHSLALQKQPADPTRQPLQVYHLSHDLRGPLNSILGFAELLLEGIEGPLNEIQKADIAAIYQSGQNLLHLIHTMVDLSKLDANLLTFDVRAVDLKDAVKSVLAVLSRAKPERIILNLALPPDLPPLRADRVRLEQILRNLLRRAFKLSRDGTITLSAEPSGPEMILRLEISHVELLQGEIAGLLELGIKTDISGRNEIGWGGLDLPLARYLAEQQQGRAWAERYQDSGLVIYVALPVAG